MEFLEWKKEDITELLLNGEARCASLMDRSTGQKYSAEVPELYIGRL